MSDEMEVAVMMRMETREEVCMFVGTESECMDFIEENEDQHPECTMFMQFV